VVTVQIANLLKSFILYICYVQINIAYFNYTGWKFHVG